MSRNTRMKYIAAQGMADLYAEEEEDEFTQDQEDLIEDFMIDYQDLLTEQEIIKAFLSVNWNTSKAYNALDKLAAKKELKIKEEKEKLALKKQGSSQKNMSQQKNDDFKANQNNMKKNQSEEEKQDTLELKIKKQVSNSSTQQKTNKVGEFIQVQKNFEKFNSSYPEIIYDAQNRNQELDSLNLVIVGHVDSGKSTLIGHLCHLNNIVSKKLAHKIEKDSINIGRESYKYAWLSDEYEGEREKGITIDIGFKVIKTKNKVITFLDAPGHKDYIPNMIQGVTQADYALLVVESSLSAFEKGFDYGQTKEHAFLVKELGVQKLIILINKMDIIKWDEYRYITIQQQMTEFLLTIGYSQENLIFLPISAFFAENIVDKIDIPEASWYEGNCLMDVIDQLSVPERKLQSPMRLNIYNSFYQQNRGFVLQGKVEGGAIFEKQIALIMPQGLLVLLKDITKEGEKVKMAIMGDNVDITISHKEDCELKSGNVLCCLEHPIPTSKIFTISLCAFKLTQPILKGTQVAMYINSQQFPGTIKKIIAILDKVTGEVVKKNPKCLRSDEQAQLEISTESEQCMELYSNFTCFGRVVVRENMNTLGVGRILKIG